MTENVKHITLSLFLAISMVLKVGICPAQVKSGSFNFALKTLLSKSTPAINIPEAAAHHEDYLFLDAREPEEYQVSHLHNALFVGAKNFNLNRLKSLNKNQPIVVYCSIGKRSEEITLKLKKAGFTNVKNLYGGIFEWVNEGHPVYNSENHLTDTVHAYGRFWGRWLDKGVKVYD